MSARLASGASSRFRHLERWRVERIVNGAQAIRPLGVALAGIVLEAGWVGEKQGRHYPPMGGGPSIAKVYKREGQW